MKKGILWGLAVLMPAILACGEAALAWEKDEKTVTVANLNIFHGIPCAAAGDKTQCRLAERIDLLFKHLAALGCPDIVTLQEVLDRDNVLSLDPTTGSPGVIRDLTSALRLIQDKLSDGSDGVDCSSAYPYISYSAALTPDPRPLFEGTDGALLLSRYPIEHAEVRLLHSALFVPLPPPNSSPFLQAFARHVLFARIVDHPVGHPIQVFTTHLAASEDFGDNPCASLLRFPAAGLTFDVACPAECDGAETVRQCEARQVANFVKEHLQEQGAETLTVIAGDINAKPHSAVYKEFTKAERQRELRWIDSYVAAENPECKRRSGIGCTAGRDAVGGDLENPEPNVDERIDYIFVVPSKPALRCTLEDEGTGLFAAQPNPFEEEPCGPSGPICWASDHNGTRATLSCKRSAHHHVSSLYGDNREDTR
jgi:endonuclease/exonuclease/phosphatase family metal-dependent hydrolase